MKCNCLPKLTQTLFDKFTFSDAVVAIDLFDGFYVFAAKLQRKKIVHYTIIEISCFDFFLFLN